MNLTDLKKLFRKNFPIVAGGPTNLARSRGAIECLDALAEEMAANAGAEFLTGTYTIQPADLPAPAITVPNAAIFAMVGIEDSTTGSLNPLAYGSGYTQAGNVLTILAAASAQAGEVVHYSYLAGSISAGGGGGGQSYTAGPGIDITGAVISVKAETYTDVPFTPDVRLDLAAPAQLLSLTNNVGFLPALNKAKGRKVRVFLFNTASTAVTMSFPSDWTFIGPRPGVLAAGKQAVLTLESPRGAAETDILAGYASEL